VGRHLGAAGHNSVGLDRLALFPEPVTIAAGESEILDVLVKHQGDADAFGWNNEAYLSGWRPPHYPLAPGAYRIDVEILSVSASDQRRAFEAHVGATIEDASLKPL